MKKVCYNKNSNRIVLYHPYDIRYIEFVKTIPGKWWEPDLKVWTLPNQRKIIDKFAELISRFEMELDSSLQDSVFCDFILSEDELIKSPISLSEEKSSQLLSILKTKRKPREYQLAGVDQMFQWKSVLNGDDMGLGKTGQAIMTVELTQSFPCLVICPASVKWNWPIEWRKWFPTRTISVIDELGDSFFTDVLIINYDRVYKTKKFLKLVPWKSIICDECHKLKNAKSQRSEAVKEIIEGVERKIFLSGTMILNQPSELINPLTLLGVFDLLFGGWKDYVERYCNGHQEEIGYGENKKKVWDISGASNLVELNMILRRSVYIRREKREVLDELPDIQYSMIETQIDNRREYRIAEEDLIFYLKYHVSLIASQNAANAEQLVLLNTLRKLVAKGKLTSIYDFIDDFIEGTDRKLLVFGIHKEIIQSIIDHYKCLKIDGSIDSKFRPSIVQKFSTNTDRLMVANIEAAGTGTDGLQENCSDMLIVEFPDRPTDIDQIVSRLERMGQKNAINIYYLQAQDTIDIHLWDSLERKRNIVESVNKGVSVDRNNSIMRDVLENYLKTI